ncbi:TolC family protein [Enterocloster lavalensis]|uniref:TolC family protein n=1 Tax=Enterocloster lavalensis TaxID=460384 RepID=UPI001D08DB48|nr:TolC family protein [Enterocloster lavalensis]MCB6342906.1 TolC family protein [Enterocloster lavalensis]
MKDNRLKRGAMAAGAVGMSLFMTAAFPMSALAGSPEFAYTQEKWAALRDNVMEYEELNDLIHEYNATVLNNRAEYDDYRGKSSDRFKNDYADTVQDLYDASDKMLENVDEDQPGYASALAGSISTRIQAQRMQETADSENMDGDIKKLEYDRQEAELVRTAQTKMNQYWQKVKNRQSLEASLSLAQARESAAAVRVQAGMEPQARLMEAQEAVQSAQASIQASDQEMDTVRRELCLLTGWSYDASPEIREIPVTRTVDLGAIDLEGDKQRAVEQNYALRAAKGKMNNTNYGTVQNKVLQVNVGEAEQKIKTDVEKCYQNLKQAQSDQDQAAAELALEQRNLDAASRKLENGSIKRNEYLEIQDGYAAKAAAEQVSALKLTQAQEDYWWAVNGLADAGSL